MTTRLGWFPAKQRPGTRTTTNVLRAENALSTILKNDKISNSLPVSELAQLWPYRGTSSNLNSAYFISKNFQINSVIYFKGHNFMDNKLEKSQRS